jgi:hypothetical protein
MNEKYTIEIDTRGHALWYREPGKVFRFAMDTRARPMVVYAHEYSDGRQPVTMRPLSETDRERISTRLFTYLMKSRVRLKVSFTGLRTPRPKSGKHRKTTANKSLERTRTGVRVAQF